MEQPGQTVVVTGFGPFGEHAVNASWTAVQELQQLGLGDGVRLHVYEIPVDYRAAQRLVPELWERHSPQLVVHVGVSGLASSVTLESCGHNSGYCRPDNRDFSPCSGCCVDGGPDCLSSVIDMDAVCCRLAARGLDVALSTSQDAGRFLCDFTYFLSLLQGCGRAAFVHVPPVGRPYSARQLGLALRAVVLEMLAQLGPPAPRAS
ncbi:pyroglutamyl-peptidase 1 isoform X3 [Erinaceus europaeus]|uniref:Pyroglutamyl-peptidase 1 isoform X3 n=1 Tax=Erinaceus europaeus TaxID=9365 RepID=A0A1S3ADI8_ERIEU|nr:pyroglutamyl-peptidase 1 isoform X3 [Erinaceus europaeus]